jgi:hypothetical protein
MHSDGALDHGHHDAGWNPMTRDVGHVAEPSVSLEDDVHQIPAYVSAWLGDAVQFKFSDPQYKGRHQCAVDFTGQPDFGVGLEVPHSLQLKEGKEQNVSPYNQYHGSNVVQQDPVFQGWWDTQIRGSAMTQLGQQGEGSDVAGNKKVESFRLMPGAGKGIADGEPPRN